MFNKVVILSLGSIFLALTLRNLSATIIAPVTIDEAIGDAGFIFQGTVTKIESRVATDFGTNYQADFYAFVTFRIEQTFKGEVEGGSNTLTLPFVDCYVMDVKKHELTLKQKPSMESGLAIIQQQPYTADQPGEGMACHTHGMPSFTVGESDILFVQKDISGSRCPLVGWGQGRYSIINNKIYPVTWITPKGEIDFAPYGVEEEQEAEKLGQVLPNKARQTHWQPPKMAKRMGPDEFGEYIERNVIKLGQAQFLAKTPPLAPIKNANKNNPYYFRASKYNYEEAQKRKQWFKQNHINGIDPQTGKKL